MAPVNRPSRTSRLCVKNLPKHLTEARFKEFFGQKGQVTDVKILRTQNNESRRMGFVGFATEAEASRARNHFNQTFIDTSRIQIEYALPVGDDRLARPWSKYSAGSSRHIQKNPQLYKEAESSKNAKTDDGKADWRRKMALAENSDLFKEFLSAVKPRRKGKFWGNDDAGVEQVQIVQSKKPGGQGVFFKQTHTRFGGDDMVVSKKEEAANHVDDDGDSDSDDEAFDNPMMGSGEPLRGAVTDSDNSDSDSDDAPTKVESEANAETPKKSNVHPDRQKLQQESSSLFDDDDDDDDGGLQSAATKRAQSKHESSEEVDLTESGRLFVRNLSYAVGEDDITKLFSKHGELSEVFVPKDDIGRGKGFAMIQFMLPEHAIKALHALDGKVFQGRLLHILPAKPRPEAAKEDESQNDSLTYKKKQELKRNKQGQSQHNWNSLFIRGDTVASAAAEKFGITKGELLDRDADNLAVRMALAETHAISETKAFLEKNGVSPGVFDGEKTTSRSNTCILVKNIPFSTDEDEIRELFEPFGSLGRVLLPPSKTMAIVEFLESVDARKSFRGLAYRKFKHLPLYLEWAPVELFASEYSASESAVIAKSSEDIAAGAEADVAEDDDVADAADLEGTTLFVKNLNFRTVESKLEDAFGRIGKVRSAMIARRKDTSEGAAPTATLSRGYGFVEFYTRQDALKALKKLQGHMIEGHAIDIKASNRSVREGKSTIVKRKRSETESGEDVSTTKILVKNVPFEAKPKELRDLFATFGQVKSCRIPKKSTGGHRGFAFVEFSTKQEARSAFESLSSTHLYGRHLVLGWAKADDTLEELREKASQQLNGLSQKKRKVGDVDNSARSFAAGFDL